MGGFRDDREAARVRIEALESEAARMITELDALAGERIRATELERRLTAAHDELRRLRDEEPKAARRLRTARTVAAFSLLVASIVAVFYGVHVYDAAARARNLEALAAHERASAIFVPLRPGEWSARIVSAQGERVPAVGTRCTVLLHEGTPPRSAPHFPANGETVVRCGDTLVYRGRAQCRPERPPFTQCTDERGSTRMYVDSRRAFIQEGPANAWSAELAFNPSE